eukprot:CAMPEP_0181326550 /NCGR_PEP_ID=MMETSP1101-20121128/21569_1 /TAXON_ID=46948 /ORGANISM="Rhodomonas abbreviata, Strain Caron Lab Isolate" /LENGTH=97 /DNA_ID=CAMNT_0023435033 /DNA_START=61 /DNA_END=354 /DNA_ORIENTATION=+
MGASLLLFPIAGALAFTGLAPVSLYLLGFTQGGITAGSTAATLMSTSAVAGGGGIAAGGLVATLQSAGVLGFSCLAKTAVAGIGAALGLGAATISPL